MKSLRYYGPGALQLEEQPEPKPRDGEVLISVEACGICATDVKTYLRGHPKIKPGAGLGHEVAGTIIEAPASHQWKSGMRVTVAPYVPCGSCELCRKGEYSLCPRLFDDLLDPGGFSEFLRVPRRIVEQGMLALPDSLPATTGCLAEPVACCLHALRGIDLQPNESVLIIGDGVMGLLQAEIARSLGASVVILSGMTPARLERAKDLAHVVVNASTEDVSSVVAKSTMGLGPDKVLVSAADKRAAQLGLEVVRKGGAVNFFAGMPKGATLELDMNRIHYDEVELTGSFGFAPADFREAVALMASGQIDPGRLVTSYVTLDRTMDALEKLAHFEGLKTIVQCSRPGAN